MNFYLIQRQHGKQAVTQPRKGLGLAGQAAAAHDQFKFVESFNELKSTKMSHLVIRAASSASTLLRSDDRRIPEIDCIVILMPN